ncbi:MAG: type I-C CRISPR-associated protein Cas7/Csd2 [Acidobacteriota bacterium]|jgi:CRISPR-associated protein Csd2|nr:type I-C CRISPR-associated protein Cas7/Csd2 [Acidobacteriota bacterium]
MSTPLKNRYDFVLIFDVKDGNPNGDPDAGNLPRVDPETGCGLVTDVCLKRKIRNYVQLTQNEGDAQKSFDIYVKEKAVLGRSHVEAFRALGIELGEAGTEAVPTAEETERGREWMCKKFYDIRTFGAVMSLRSAPNCGQVRGPVQMTFSRSVDPIVTLEHSITRMAVATEAEAEKQGGDNRTMGRKSTVPYGLYVGYGFVSAHLAAQTGFDEKDLSILWEALKSMFEHDRSAARGMMATRKLVVFKHASALGNAPAHELFDLVKISRNEMEKPARAFSDYSVVIDDANLPQGVELIELV